MRLNNMRNPYFRGDIQSLLRYKTKTPAGIVIGEYIQYIFKSETKEITAGLSLQGFGVQFSDHETEGHAEFFVSGTKNGGSISSIRLYRFLTLLSHSQINHG